MPLRVPHPTAQATAPTPGSPVSMAAAVWSATATTPVTVTLRLSMGHTATTVSAVGYGRNEPDSIMGCKEGEEGGRTQCQHWGRLWSSWAPEL